MKILVPAGVPFDARPELDDPNDAAVPYPPDGPLPAEHLDAEAIVLWSTAPELMTEAVEKLTDLRWVQALAAGPDSAIKAGFPPTVTITSGVGLHDTAVAEHTLALTLATVRRLDRTIAAQRQHKWDTQLMQDQTAPTESRGYTLDNARVTIWGFGSIGTRVALYLTALGAAVTGVARSAGERHGFPVVTEDELDTLLPETDVLISILPSGPATERALNADRLALLPSTAHFINVGRGSTVDELALIAALTSGRLAGAAIDVAAGEPLAPDSPLWDTSNLIITPHVAGGRPTGVKEFLTAQVRAWKHGGPEALANVVRPSRA